MKFFNWKKEEIKNVEDIGENTYTEVDGKEEKVIEILNCVKEFKEKEKQNAEKEKMKEDKDFMNDDTMIDIGKDEKATLKDLINIYKNVKKNEDDEKMKDKKEEKNKLELEEKNSYQLVCTSRSIKAYSNNRPCPKRTRNCWISIKSRHFNFVAS